MIRRKSVCLCVCVWDSFHFHSCPSKQGSLDKKLENHAMFSGCFWSCRFEIFFGSLKSLEHFPTAGGSDIQLIIWDEYSIFIYTCIYIYMYRTLLSSE